MLIGSSSKFGMPMLQSQVRLCRNQYASRGNSEIIHKRPKLRAWIGSAHGGSVTSGLRRLFFTEDSGITEECQLLLDAARDAEREIVDLEQNQRSNSAAELCTMERRPHVLVMKRSSMSNALILLRWVKHPQFQQMQKELVCQLPHNYHSQRPRRKGVQLQFRSASEKSTLSERQHSRIINFFTASECVYYFLNRIAFGRAAEADRTVERPFPAVAR